MPAPKESFIAVGEYGADATRELHATIKQFTHDSTRQTTKLIGLTWAIIVLTIIMLIEVGVQTWAILR
jgi:hypothetical protein